jgi:hypothetical protein
MTTDPKRPYVSVDLSTFTETQREAYNILWTWRTAGLGNGEALGELFGFSTDSAKLSQLQTEALEFTTEGTIHRYLVARNFNAEAALSLLKGTLKWRSTYISRTTFPAEAETHLVCEKCQKSPTAHYFFPAGWDDSGRVVIYGCQPRMNDNEVEGTVYHCMRSLEKAWRHPRSSGQFDYVVDFNGFGLRHATYARLGITWAGIFASHLPERLGHLFLINPPGIFDLFFKAGKAFADQRTLDKIVIVRGTAAEVVGKLAGHGITEMGTRSWLEKAFAMDPYTKDKALIAAGTMPKLPVLSEAEAKELGIGLKGAADGGEDDKTLGSKVEIPETKMAELRARGIYDPEVARDLWAVQLVPSHPWC